MRRSFLLAPLLRAFPAASQPAPPPPSVLDAAASLLATLIRSARDSAIAGGVKPLPSPIHRALLGYFPDALLRKVRYTSGHADAISIPGLALEYGHIEAVTLIDVVLFRRESDARGDARLWARELTHVMQYERWGVEEFAWRFVHDHQAIEQEARDNAERYVAWSQHAHL